MNVFLNLWLYFSLKICILLPLTSYQSQSSPTIVVVFYAPLSSQERLAMLFLYRAVFSQASVSWLWFSLMKYAWAGVKKGPSSLGSTGISFVPTTCHCIQSWNKCIPIESSRLRGWSQRMGVDGGGFLARAWKCSLQQLASLVPVGSIKTKWTMQMLPAQCDLSCREPCAC